MSPTLSIKSNSYMLETHSEPPVRGESNIIHFCDIFAELRLSCFPLIFRQNPLIRIDFTCIFHSFKAKN